MPTISRQRRGSVGARQTARDSRQGGVRGKKVKELSRLRFSRQEDLDGEEDMGIKMLRMSVPGEPGLVPHQYMTTYSMFAGLPRPLHHPRHLLQLQRQG